MAVFGSWNTSRAVRYREIEGIRGLLGTAVNVQSMVYGNMGDDSGTGVAFTRNPNTGENKFFGEFLINAQGEDVVAGIRTPQPVADMPKWNRAVYKELLAIKKILKTTIVKCRTSNSRLSVERCSCFRPDWQADRRCGQDRLRHGQRGSDRPERSCASCTPNDLTQLLLRFCRRHATRLTS